MNKLNLTITMMSLLTMILGCGGMNSKPAPEWTKSRKIAGYEQKITHISGLVVDDKFAYVTTGGNLADQERGLSGLRKVALNSGAVTILDDGKFLPQSDYGGIALDERYVYWNVGGDIRRVSKDGGNSETIASENVGIGIDMVVDKEKIYWTNHGYYSSNNAPSLKPIYAISKQGGASEIFADGQKVPGNLVADEKFIYWTTVNGVMKLAKSGGQPQVVYQATNEENVDHLSQDAESLYFGFRSAGSPRWSLRKVSKQGGDSPIIAKTYSLKPVVVDDANIYFFDEESLMKDVLCKVSKNGGEIAKLDVGYSSGVIAQSATLVYFASSDDIYGFTK